MEPSKDEATDPPSFTKPKSSLSSQSTSLSINHPNPTSLWKSLPAAVNLTHALPAKPIRSIPVAISRSNSTSRVSTPSNSLRLGRKHSFDQLSPYAGVAAPSLASPAYSHPAPITHQLPAKPSFLGPVNSSNSLLPECFQRLTLPNTGITATPGPDSTAASTATKPVLIDEHIAQIKIMAPKAKKSRPSASNSTPKNKPNTQVTDGAAGCATPFALLVDQLGLQELKSILKAELKRLDASLNSSLPSQSSTSSDPDSDEAVVASSQQFIERQDMTTLRKILKKEENRKDHQDIIKSVERYFDLSRKNNFEASVEQQYGIILHSRDTNKSKALKEAVSYVNFRSKAGTKENTLKALRESEKDDVRGYDQRGTGAAVLDAMTTVILCMTKQERKNFVNHYGSFNALSNFWKNLPSDQDPDGWLEEPEEKWAKDEGRRLDDAILMSKPVEDGHNIILADVGVVLGQGGDSEDVAVQHHSESLESRDDFLGIDDGWGDSWDRERSKKRGFREVYGTVYHVDGISDQT